MNTYLTMLLETGGLHADPHPGNLLRTPDGRLCILDWGLVTSLDKAGDVCLQFTACGKAVELKSCPLQTVRTGREPRLPCGKRQEHNDFLTASGQERPSAYYRRQLSIPPTEGFRVAYIEHIAHLVSGDYDPVANDLVLLGFVPDGMESQVLESDVVGLLANVYGQWGAGGGAAKVDVNKIFGDLQDLSGRYSPAQETG